MRALIVDDEKHVREGIKILAEWEENDIHEIYEAANGEEAIRLIEAYKPEIIFSDMKMPKMDGVSLLEWIKEHQPSSKTIVITGYDDYHYMRKAIHYGSSDYLLKPIEPEILNQTLEKAINEWKEEEADRERKKSSSQLINEMKPVYRDRKLTQLMNSEVSQENLYEEFGILQADTYTVAILRINGITIQSFKGDRDLAYFTILNIINELLFQRECGGVGFRYLSSKGEIAIILWEEYENTRKTLQHIYKAIERSIGISCPIALGQKVTSCSKLMDSYQYAKQILLNSNLLEIGRVYIEESIPSPELRNLTDYSANIELAVQAGEIEAFEEVINQITSDITANGQYLSLKQLLHIENEYLVISNRWFKKYHLPVPESSPPEKRVDLFFSKDGTFLLESYKQRIKREISVFLKRIKRGTQERNNIIYEIEKYLQENFDRDVKLQEISEHFYISREYISRKFKQEFGVNITDYIVKFRMNKAKSLLKNSQLKIYEIANMIGYQDDKYFRKVFKKVEGVTPNEYRGQ